MKLQKAVEQYREAKNVIEKDLNGIPSANRPSWEIRKRDATESLPRLTQELGTAAQEELSVLVLRGDEGSLSDAIKAISDFPNVIVGQPNLPFMQMARFVFPMLGEQKVLSELQFPVFYGAVNTVARELGFFLTAMIEMPPSCVVVDELALSLVIQRAIPEGIRNVFVKKSLEAQVVEGLLAKSEDAGPVFFVIPEEDYGVSFKNITRATVSPPIDKEVMSEMFDALTRKVLGVTREPLTVGESQQPEPAAQEQQVEPVVSNQQNKKNKKNKFNKEQ